MALPQAFLARMEDLLGGEYPAFVREMAQPPLRGVRRNSLRCDEATLARSVPWALRPTPFSPLSFTAQGEARPGALPAHHAGMFYAQEPSAASAVTALDPQPGERVLDLCAAPGGKATQIAALLAGQGLLWANEIVRGRAAALLSNVERMGAVNAVVSCARPDQLCAALGGYFDRVLVDAPCSGEGMFRRDPAAAAEWTPESPAACARRQLAILDSAVLAVREGGVLVYSTCTFSREENEDVVRAFLHAHPDFSAEAIPAAFGRPDLDGGLARRIFPMDGGEGHFVARFRRTGENPCAVRESRACAEKKDTRDALALWGELFAGPPPERFLRAGDCLFLPPSSLPELSGLPVLRAGVPFAQRRGNRLEPLHGLWMSRLPRDCLRRLDFSPEDPDLAAFYRGEEFPCTERGYTGVSVNGVLTGFGKAGGGVLKNRYPKGLRSLSG